MIPNYTHFTFVPKNPEFKSIDGQIQSIDESDFHSVFIHIDTSKKIQVNKILLFSFPEGCTAYYMDDEGSLIYGRLVVFMVNNSDCS